MLVVNMLGGPGAGKTYAAWNLAAELKHRGYVVEYVPEYAKEFVWENRLDKLADQEALFREQFRRINRLNGKVDIAITDSPLILSEIYGKNNSSEFIEDIHAAVNRFNNFNVMVYRDNKHYEQQGRIHSLEESKAIDERIVKLLDKNRMFYGAYTHERLPYLSKNIGKTIDRLNSRPISTEKKIQSELERFLIEHDEATATDFISSASRTYSGEEIKRSLENWHPISAEEKDWFSRFSGNLFHNSNGTTYLICAQKNDKSLLYSLSNAVQSYIVVKNLRDNNWDYGKYFSDSNSAKDYFKNCTADEAEDLEI